VGGGPDLQDKVPEVRKSATRRHGGGELQEAFFLLLPATDRSLQYRAVPQLDEEPVHPSVVVVLEHDPDSRVPLQGVRRGRPNR